MRVQFDTEFGFDKVLNVYGSSAGAGSGDFHAYRHSRDKEKRRISRNKAILKEKLERDAFDRAVEEAKEECDARTRRNRTKRRRKKERKARAKRMRKSASEFGAMEPSSKATVASKASGKAAVDDGKTVKPAAMEQAKGSGGDGVAASASAGSEATINK